MDDLTNLSDLNENSLLEILAERYKNDQIYTCIGDIIIAANPYKQLSIYGREKMQEYSDVTNKDEHRPHIYLISDRAYLNMKRSNLDQCCVVSGESGAGKTESTKLLIEHIAYLCKHDDSKLDEKIVEVNPLLEAFGNAKTVINNNSSRFGKFIQLVFNDHGQIWGARLSEYLLEKSRVVFHAPGEKNFHIFYYFFAGVDEKKLKANKLLDPEKHRIMMNHDGAPVYENKQNLDECRATWGNILSVMKHVGFTEEEINEVEALLTVVVHVSDVTFLVHPETDGVSIQDDETIALCAQLLGVDAEALVDSLISNRVKAGAEWITSLKNEIQASDSRDALAKALYGRLFIWIVTRINQLLDPKVSSKGARNDSHSIGILDIYGFENFASNSFEQLCINITNEQLQLFFNEHIFRLEMTEYRNEGIPGDGVEYVDNKALLDLFLESKDSPSMLAILDEESRFPQGSDQTFIDKLVKNMSNKSEFQSTKGQSKLFTIKHFAGPVTYNVDGFLEKNRDTLSDNIVDCLKGSDCQLVSELFSPFSTIAEKIKDSTMMKKGKRMSTMFGNWQTLRVKQVNSIDQMKRQSIISSKPSVTSQSASLSQKIAKTLAVQFKGSLQTLVEKLIQAEPHFIRCIKPNGQKESDNFEHEMVLQQLNYTGILETIKIRKQGYSTRLLFGEFVHRYGIIGGVISPNNESDTCKTILDASKLTEWQIGKTKVFLRHWHTEKLNALMSAACKMIVNCQKYWRGTLARKTFDVLRAKAVEYKTAYEELHKLVSEVGERFQAEQKKSLDVDGQSTSVGGANAKAGSAELAAKEGIPRGASMATIRGPIGEPKKRGKCQPIPEMYLPPSWQPVVNGYQTDPYFVFLQESLVKLNAVQKEIWCKLYLMERNAIIGKLYVRDHDVLVDGSKQNYTGSVIGLKSNAFEHLRETQCLEIIENFGKGLRMKRDAEGSVYLSRQCDIDVIVYGDARFVLPSETTKVFDMKKFKNKVVGLLKTREAMAGHIDVHRIARWSMLSFSIGGTPTREVEQFVWISIINIHALDLIGDEDVFKEFISDGSLPPSANKLKESWSQLNFLRR